MHVEECDYIVVGAGSAGCVVAGRLSESGKHRVALLEAGGEDDNFWIHTPLGYGKLYDNPKYNWTFEADAEEELGGHSSYQPRGKVLGGTGSINGMIYVRGQREDFELWRQLGNAGWGPDDVLRYYKKTEDNIRGANDYHAEGGPVRISEAPKHPLADAFLAAGAQAGFALNADSNGAVQEGFGYNQMNIRNGRRDSPADAFVRPAQKRSNFLLFKHALASRIIIRDGEAVGVEFRQNGKVKTLLARREVIISGGAFNSPQLLQLSGIGPGDLLRRNGIEVVKELKGVGENLQDHFFVPLTYRCTQPITINDIVNSPLRGALAGLQYLLFKSGPLAANASLCGGFIRTNPNLASPDVRLNLQLWNRASHGRSKKRVGLTPYSAFGTNVVLLHPDNRGVVRIKDADPAEPPYIKFNLFASESDQRTSITALRIMRKVMSMPAIAPYVKAEEDPGAGVATDDEILAYCRQRGRSNHHAAGTCRMGVDEDCVVDPRLRVHGIGRLRVADASIMPRIVSGNTHAPAMMIGEKCADMVLEDAASS